ncbi:hypothetical protein AB0E59_32235 [Lentzea sp. NPDC034063]|uniref:hypothetical protein n=1 Tax=unclassified Lentzea TaxID=2643253 RepID=UPI0033F74D49
MRVIDDGRVRFDGGIEKSLRGITSWSTLPPTSPLWRERLVGSTRTPARVHGPRTAEWCLGDGAAERFVVSESGFR